eukprot:8435003-Alexandrium_andersonii.AAC.1
MKDHSSDPASPWYTPRSRVCMGSVATQNRLAPGASQIGWGDGRGAGAVVIVCLLYTSPSPRD